jgi:fibronectin-binding autotransporter adhesin
MSAVNVISGRVFYNSTANILGTGTITVGSGAGLVYLPATANTSFTLANPITVLSGGNLASRSGTGTLTLSGVVTLPTSGNIFFNLDDASTGTLTMSNAANVLAATHDLTFQIGLDGLGTGIAYSPTGAIGIGQVNLNHLISGAVNLTKRAGGTLALTNSGNTFGGAGNTITILGGNLSVSADAQLGNAANSITFSNPRTGPISSAVTSGENILNKQFDQQTGNSNFSALWTGTFTPAVNGVHTFGTNSDDGSMFYIDADLDGDFESIASERIVNNNGSQGLTTVIGNTPALTAGTPYPIAIAYFQGTGGGGIQARWAAGTSVPFASQAIVDPSDPAQAGRWSSIHGVNSLEERVYTGAPGSDYLDNTGTGLDDGGVTRSLLNQAPLPTGLLNIAGTFTSARNIVLNAQGGLNINSSVTLTHTGLISGIDVGAGMGADGYNGLNAGLTKAGAGTLVLNTSNNTYFGPTSIRGGVLEVNALNNGGVPGRLGQSTNAAANLWLDGGTLRYNGSTAGSTDRNFTLTTAGGGIENNSAAATSTLTMASTDAVRLFTTGASTPMTEAPPFTPPVGSRTLTLSGSNTGANLFAPALTDDVVGANVGQTRLTKNGAGTWVLNNNGSSYSGITTIIAGLIRATGGNVLGTPGTGPGGTQVQPGATLELNGNFTLAAKPILVGGSGVGSAGALLATGDVTVPAQVTQNGATTIRATTGNELILTSGVRKDGDNGALTFAGGGDITVNGAITDVAADYTLSALTGRGYLSSAQAITTAATMNSLTAAVSTPVESNSATLTGALNFPNDATLATFFGNGSYSTVNPYTTVFFGVLNVTTAGTYSFGANPHDDSAAVWLDDDGNGVFETTGVSDLVFSSGCCNSTTVGMRTLAPGSYTIAYSNVDTGGGGSLVGRIQGPGGVGQTNSSLLNIVNPAGTTSATDVVVHSSGTRS